MKRRLYFLLPGETQVLQVVEELKQSGIPWKQMHVVGPEGVELTDLPPATTPQKRDLIWRIERLVWRGDLIIFFLALLALIISLFWGFSTWSVLAIAVMIVTFVFGTLFAIRIPHTHLTEFREAIDHGDLLLMVDVAKEQVKPIEDLVHHHHPDATSGGVGWTINALGI